MSYESYLLVLLIICMYVSIVDFIHRKIHNHTLWMLLFFQYFLSPLDIQLTTFLVVLVGGLILYAFIWVGAGDIKYAAVLSLTIPLQDLLWSLVMMAFFGGFLAIAYLVNRKLVTNTANTREGIPYGIAISVGFYLVILTQNTPHI